MGDVVGYNLMFEEEISDQTRITYTTYEKLFRLASQDPGLTKHNVLILDDVHQRTKYSDSVCDYVKRIRKSRTDLKIIITCSLDEGKKLQQYFDCPLLSIPVPSPTTEIYYTAEPEVNFIESAARSVVQIHTTEQPGNILVFLPKVSDIIMTEKFIKRMLKKLEKASPLLLISFHEEQTLEEILQSFSLIWSKDPKIMKSRKCILGTDMLETCLNVGEIRYIVDPGYTLEKNFASELAVEYKKLTNISKAKATKRANAVTNTYKEAKCFRLYTQKSFKSDLEEIEDAELMRSDLSIISLIFSKLKIREILSLEADVITSALELLGYIEALDEHKNITEFGEVLLSFPIDPQLAVSIISSSSYKCCESMLTIAAMLVSKNCFLETKDQAQKARDALVKFTNSDGDHFILLNIYNHFISQENPEEWCRAHFIDYAALVQATKIRAKLVSILEKNKIEIAEDSKAPDFIDNIKKCLLLGHVKQVAMIDRVNGTYRLIRDGTEVILYPSALLLTKPDLCIYNEVVMTTKVNIKTVTCIKKEFLEELVPDYLKICKVLLDV